MVDRLAGTGWALRWAGAAAAVVLALAPDAGQAQRFGPGGFHEGRLHGVAGYGHGGLRGASRRRDVSGGRAALLGPGPRVGAGELGAAGLGPFLAGPAFGVGFGAGLRAGPWWESYGFWREGWGWSSPWRWNNVAVVGGPAELFAVPPVVYAPPPLYVAPPPVVLGLTGAGVRATPVPAETTTLAAAAPPPVVVLPAPSVLAAVAPPPVLVAPSATVLLAGPPVVPVRHAVRVAARVVPRRLVRVVPVRPVVPVYAYGYGYGYRWAGWPVWGGPAVYGRFYGRPGQYGEYYRRPGVYEGGPGGYYGDDPR